MTERGLSDEFVAWLLQQKMSLRAQKARDVLLERGSVTTAELNDMGYDHPPRVIGDLKDAGIAVSKENVTVDGRRMARYRLVETMSSGATSRRPLSREFRKAVYDAAQERCAVCNGWFEFRYLQTDHRIPFRVGGDPDPLTVDAFMPLCSQDNRAKSWSCEHCANWQARIISSCIGCYWGNPSNYSHIAGIDEARLVVLARGADVDYIKQLEDLARQREITAGQLALEKLRAFLESESD